MGVNYLNNRIHNRMDIHTPMTILRMSFSWNCRLPIRDNIELIPGAWEVRLASFSPNPDMDTDCRCSISEVLKADSIDSSTIPIDLTRAFRSSNKVLWTLDWLLGDESPSNSRRVYSNSKEDRIRCHCCRVELRVSRNLST